MSDFVYIAAINFTNKLGSIICPNFNNMSVYYVPFRDYSL